MLYEFVDNLSWNKIFSVFDGHTHKNGFAVKLLTASL